MVDSRLQNTHTMPKPCLQLYKIPSSPLDFRLQTSGNLSVVLGAQFGKPLLKWLILDTLIMYFPWSGEISMYIQRLDH